MMSMSVTTKREKNKRNCIMKKEKMTEILKNGEEITVIVNKYFTF